MFGIFEKKEFEQPVRVELQIPEGSKLLKTTKTIGQLKEKYPKLEFVKYIYIDPTDGMLKGVNPSGNIPLVAKSNITVAGNLSEIIKFSKIAVSKE